MNTASDTILESSSKVNLTPREQKNFWKRVSKTDSCWNWIGAKDKDGYGSFSLRYATERSHRISYRIHAGRIPNGILVCHNCDNPSCVNPAHLFLGTPQDNMDDKVEKGRVPRGRNHYSVTHPEKLARGERSGSFTHPEKICRGESHGRAKLTAEKVLRIRSRFANGGISQKQLALESGVGTATMNKIIHRAYWSHI